MYEPAHLVVDRPNRYRAVVTYTHDGDTIYCLVRDPLLNIDVQLGCRLRGVQAPELAKPGGPYVRDALSRILPAKTVLTASDVGAYPRAGHITCRLTTGDGTDLSQWLLDRHLAVPYDGVGAPPEVPWPPPDWSEP